MLITADPAAIAYLIHLDEREASFIIDKTMDERHLLVNLKTSSGENTAKYIQKKLEELADKNHFQPEQK